jgi:acyl-CoA reductase-like NAD-dependent aldehyde dehydrogenase
LRIDFGSLLVGRRFSISSPFEGLKMSGVGPTEHPEGLDAFLETTPSFFPRVDTAL